MFERFKDCVCHPRYIGKYNKDKGGIVFLTILIFFFLSILMQGIRSYTANPISETFSYAMTSTVIQHGKTNVVYNAAEGKIIGDYFESKHNGFHLIVLPEEHTSVALELDAVTVILEEESATLYYGNLRASTFLYKNLDIVNFSFENVATNQATDTYYFRIFIDHILDSAKVFFQTYAFIQGIITTVVYYLICVAFSYVLSIAINPTINRGVRIKLCMYDGCVFFVGTFFAYLFNSDIITYFSLALPLVYTLVTFRHIIKVVIRR
ncbi:MAG: hypothetical protein NC310_03125 [Roseburia sp.]|nr:hypothetical protein [Anaeroplasma bactoclasticum]MCM1196051.1 hypothetical protein [Roseburia sp.]MCM1556736.1 hypothetical protein [Anaeroplasma bactoclasticum]